MSDPGSPAPKRRRWLRRLLLLSGTGLSGVVLGAALGVAFLATDPGNEVLRKGALQLSQRQLVDAELQLDGLQTRLLDGLTLEGVALRTSDGQTLIAAQELAVEWELGGLLQRDLSLPSVRIRDAEVDLRAGATGRMRLLDALGIPPGPDDAPSEPWGGLPGTLSVGAVDVAGLDLRLDGVELLDIALGGRAVVDGADVDLQDVVAAADLRGPLDRRLGLRLAGGLHAGDLDLERADVRLGASNLALTGSIATVETAPVLDLHISDALLAHAELAELAGAGAPAPDLALKGSLSGPLDLLRSQLVVDAGTGGAVHAALSADLLADRPGWSADLDARDLDLVALYPAQLDAPTQARSLTALVRGSGFSWPDAFAAYVVADARELQLFGEPVSSLGLRATVVDEEVRIHTGAVRHGAGSADLGGLVQLSGSKADLDVDLQVGRLAALRSRTGVLLEGGGRWRPEVHLDWSEGVTVDARGTLGLTGFQTSGVRVASAAGPVGLRWTDQGLTVDGALQGRGLTAPGAAASGLALDLDVGWSEARGTTVQAGLVLDEVGATSLAASVEEARGRIEVVAPPRGDTRVSGDMGLKGVRLVAAGPASAGGLSFALVGDDLSAQVDVAPADGVGPTLRAVVDRAEDGTYLIDQLLLSPVDGLTLASEAPLALRPQDVGPPLVSAELGGNVGRLTVRTEDDGAIALRGTGLALDRWARLVELLPPGEDGAVRDPLPLSGLGTADLRLVLDEAGAPSSVEGTVSVDDLGWAEDVVALDVDLDLRGPLSRPRLWLDLHDGEAMFVRARGELPLDLEGGWLACQDEVDLRAVLAPIDLAALRQHLPALPTQDAHASADLRLSGPACDPQVALSAAADTPLGRDGEVVRVDIDVERIGDQLSVYATAEEAFQRRLEVRGTAATQAGAVLAAMRPVPEGAPPRDGPDPALVGTWIDRLAINVVPLGIPLQSIGTFVDLPPGLEGRIAGGLQLTGRADAPVVAGALQLSDGRIGQVDVASALVVLQPTEQGYAATVDAMLVDPSATPDEAGGPAPTLPVRIVAGVPVALDPTIEDPLGREGLDVTLDGTLPLALLEGVVDGVRGTHGALKLDGSLKGSLGKPTGEVTITGQGLGLTHTGLGLVYDDVSIDLVATQERVVLRELIVRNRRRSTLVGRGLGAGTPNNRLLAKGSVELADLRPDQVRLTVEADDFWIIGEPDMQLAVDGQVQAEGSWPDLRLTGALSMTEASLVFDEADFVGDRTLAVDPRIRIERPSSQQEVVRVVATDDAPPVWQGFDIDVEVDLLRNLRLKATVPLNDEFGEAFAALSSVGLDADLGGVLDVSQKRGQLTLRGELETLRGSASVLGAEFDIEEGAITFLGDGFSDPLLDIEATRRVSDADVQVKVGGRVSAFDVALSSPEYPDQTDVVTLLLFGKPASQMSDSEGQANGEQVAMALASVGAGQIERAIGNDLFDQFELDPSGGVRLGWALNDKLFLRYEIAQTRDEEENVNELTLEYLISRRLYAEFKTGDRGASSINLYWRWRF
ncbi:MAG: translocation/assembly module TamB domain-containing protein [Alphaproteobacteria bacterium]|nr:translocation/assembly module TamB domain-containing protein [Alphaproteobacteria bacterium]